MMGRGINKLYSGGIPDGNLSDADSLFIAGLLFYFHNERHQDATILNSGRSLA
jgi:hypothetical protein